MTCCGKAKRIARKAGTVAKGYMAMATDKKYEFTESRVRVCRSCEYNTWLKKLEYSQWLLKHGIEVLTNLDDLTDLPMLPKKTEAKNLYCRICKCFIPAKARVEDEQCPKNKWSH